MPDVPVQYLGPPVRSGSAQAAAVGGQGCAPIVNVVVGDEVAAYEFEVRSAEATLLRSVPPGQTELVSLYNRGVDDVFMGMGAVPDSGRSFPLPPGVLREFRIQGPRALYAISLVAGPVPVRVWALPLES